MEEIVDGLKVIYGRALSSNVYLVEDEKHGILAIDAGAMRTLAIPPAMLILTHAHFDHSGGVGSNWKNVYLNKGDMRDGPYFMVPKQAKPIDFKKLKWGNFELEVLHTPGHTLGSICLFDEKKKLLISGDTLFADGVGRTDLGGDEKLMENSLALLEKLDWKLLCPGHGEIFDR